jgi:ABC-type transport system involved in cytochrome bd biosynthesis fused ATPase/permease subunit
MPSDLFTTSYLGSYAGLVAVTFLLVQFFKEPIRKHLSEWWIRLLAVFIALAIQSFTLYVAGNFTAEAIGLAVLNSFLIAITAAGMHNISQPSNDQYITLPMESYPLDGLAPIKNYNTPAASKTLPNEPKDEPPDIQQAV